MSAGDFPEMVSTSYGSHLYEPEETTTSAMGAAEAGLRARRIQAGASVQSWGADAIQGQQATSIPIMSDKIKRRVVQVFIADPNENVPLEKAVLYQGDQKLTESTDQELFFEVGLGSILSTYNTQRITWLDKEATRKAGRDVFLEPAKIRELRMVVVNVAEF